MKSLRKPFQKKYISLAGNLVFGLLLVTSNLVVGHAGEPKTEEGNRPEVQGNRHVPYETSVGPGSSVGGPEPAVDNGTLQFLAARKRQSSTSPESSICRDPEREFQEAMQIASTGERIGKLRKLVDACPNFVKGLNNLGVLLEGQGDLDGAEKHYRTAIGRDPDFPHAYAGLGDIYLRQGRFGSAVKLYRDFIERASKPDALRMYPELSTHIPSVEAKIASYQDIDADFDQGLVSAERIVARLDGSFLTRGLGIQRNVQPRIPIKVLFAFDDAQISPESAEQLKEIAKALSSNNLSKYPIAIEGHTDSVGSEPYNLRLSEKRAQSVKRHLVEKFGIDSDRLVVKNFGEAIPTASNDTAGGRQKNRRVEFVNLGNL